MNDKIVYSVFPKQELAEIFANLYNKYSAQRTTKIVINSDSLQKWVSDKEAKLLQTNFQKMPFVQINDESKRDNLFSTNKAFNEFLNSLFENIKVKYQSPKKEIDYYSKSLFEKVGNNNLDIKENDQSAALLFSL